MRYTVRMEKTYGLPKYIIGDRKGSFEEWVVWVEYVTDKNYNEPSTWDQSLKFFFDIEHEAEWYKRDLEQLISTVLEQEKKRVKKKLVELLSL